MRTFDEIEFQALAFDNIFYVEGEVLVSFWILSITKEGLLRKRFMIKDTLGDCNAYSFVKADLELIL